MGPMSQISVADILELPVQERIQLVEVIWESIAAVSHAIEVSPELKTELEARVWPTLSETQRLVIPGIK